MRSGVGVVAIYQILEDDTIIPSPFLYLFPKLKNY